MSQCIVIPTDSKPYMANLDYDKCKALIGGWLEAVHFGNGTCMMVDEEATLKDPAPPENVNATIFADKMLHRINRRLIRKGNFLLGPAVLVAYDREGDWIDLDATAIYNVINLIGVQEQ